MNEQRNTGNGEAGDNGEAPGNGEAGAQEQQTAQGPRMSIVTQYIKDLSFENPRGPLAFAQGQTRPEIQVRVDVRAAPLGPEQHEVILELNIEAKVPDGPVFLLELTYGGVFALANIPADSLQPLLLVECPRLLFPFARRIVSDLTRDGGFPPLMLDPIDFVGLYRRRMARAQPVATEGRA